MEVNGDAPFCDGVEEIRGSLELHRADLAVAVGAEDEVAAGDDPRIEKLEGAGGGVARIGEGFLAALLAVGVELCERGSGPIDLAADFEHLRPALAVQNERDAAE